MRKLFPMLMASILVVAAVSCKEKVKVDMILHNALIYTVDQNFSMVNALAVKDGRLIEVGDQEMIFEYYQSENVVDAHGKAVYPGFNDGHRILEFMD